MSIQEILGLAQATRGTFEEAEKLVKELGLTGDEAVKAVKQIRQFNSVKLDLAKQFATLNQELGLTEAQFKKLSQVAKTIDGKGGLKGLAGNAQDLFGKLGMVSFGFNQIQTAVQTMAAAARPAFDLLIGANEKLNAQLLSSQANLANATRIYKNGAELTDPTEKINASRPALKAALKQIEKDTVDLVGVTSADVNQLFQITLQNAAALNNQSKEFPKPIAAATALTKGWAASLKVMGIPLFQANQEINSIVKGQITQDSLMAKNLGINNEQVAKWKAQGILVDELNKRLQTFVVANGIASRSIEGIGSNIQDTIEIIGREAGAQLLEPVIGALDFVYQGLKNSKDSVLQFFKLLADGLTASLPGIGNALKPVFEGLGGLVAALAPGFNAIVQILFKVVEVVAGVLGPVISVLIAAITPIVQILSGALIALNALADGFLALFRSAQPLRDFLTNLFSGLFENAAAVFSGIASGFGQVLEFLNPIGDVIRALFVLAGKAFSTLADGVGKAAKPIGDFLGGIFQTARKGAGDFFNFVGSQLKSISDFILNSPGFKAARFILENLEKVTGVKIGGKAEDKKPEEKKPEANDDIDLKARALERLGTTAEQMQKKVANALKSIKEEGGGDNQIFQQAAKDVISLTQEQVEAGQITATEAAKRLSEIAGNAKVDFETQKKARDTALKVELTDKENAYKVTESNIQEQLAKGTLTQIEAEQQITDAKAKSASEQLEILRAAIALSPNNVALRLQLEKAETELAQAESKKRETAYKGEMDARDRSLKIATNNIEEQVGKGTLSQIESEKQLTELKAQESEKRLAIIRNALAQEVAAGRGGGERAKQLTLQLQQAETEAAQAAKKVRDEAFKRKVQDFDEQQKILDGSKASGLVGEQAYADQSLAITQRRLDAELAEITRQRSQIKDKEGLEELAAKEADIAKRRAEALEKLENEKLAILDRAQKKALDLVKASQTAAEIETQKLLNSREIREVEASDRGLKLKRSLLEQELKLEQEKAAAIADLPKLSDPQKEEERQSKIRATRQRTGELTLQLLQNEREQQESTARVIADKIDQQLKITLNAYTAQDQALQQESTARDFIVKSLERQNALLSAQKDLQSAISGYINGEYQLAESLTQSESKKRKLREEAARSRLAFLNREQALERQSLDLELLKNKALLEREKIQNRIAQSKGEAGLAKAIADQAKTAADPKATQADKVAADLTVRASQDELIGTRYQAKLLEQQESQDEAIGDARVRSLSYSQELKRDQARADVAKETRGRGDDRALANEFTAKARDTAFNVDPTIDIPQSTAPKFEEFRRLELAKLGRRDNAAIQQQINQVVSPTQAPIPLGLPTQQAVPTGTGQALAAESLNGLKAVIGDAISQGFAKLNAAFNVTQNNAITTNLNGGEATGSKAAENVGQQILNTLYGVGILAKAQKATR